MPHRDASQVLASASRATGAAASPELRTSLTGEAICSPLLRRLHADWDSRRRGREFPARSDFDPVDLKYILGHLMLLDVERDPFRLRYRLVGTDIVQRSGIDLTGKTVDDLPDPEYRRNSEDRYKAVLEGRVPVADSHRRVVLDNKICRFEALSLPLSSDGVTIDKILVGLIFL